jgi:hypothetical protein
VRGDNVKMVRSRLRALMHINAGVTRFACHATQCGRTKKGALVAEGAHSSAAKYAI